MKCHVKLHIDITLLHYIILRRLSRSQWPGGWHVRLRCEMTQVRISPPMAVCYPDGYCDMQPWVTGCALLRCPGQTSLASLRGREIECHLRHRKGANVTSAGWQVTLCDPVWHVSYRSGGAKLLTKGGPLYRAFTLPNSQNA